MLLSQLIGEAYRLYQKRFIIIYHIYYIIYAWILYFILVCESDDEDSGYLDEWDDNYGAQDGNCVEKNIKTDAINELPLPSPT